MSQWTDGDHVRAQAWHGLLQVQRDVSRTCDAALLRRHGLTLSGFDVLYTVGRADEGTIAMSDLVRTALLSQSQISRTVAGLAADGLLERHGAGRTVHLRITSSGQRLLADAVRTQRATLEQVLFAALDDQQTATLAHLLDRILTGTARRT